MKLQALILFCFTVNLVSFIFYGIDKYRALKKKWRIPENRLLILSFIAPIGAIGGMFLFRHKIRKPAFYISIPVFLFIHLYVCYLLYNSNLLIY